MFVPVGDVYNIGAPDWLTPTFGSLFDHTCTCFRDYGGILLNINDSCSMWTMEQQRFKGRSLRDAAECCCQVQDLREACLRLNNPQALEMLGLGWVPVVCQMQPCLCRHRLHVYPRKKVRMLLPTANHMALQSNHRQ